MGKLDKMLGIPRIAFKSYEWKGFQLQPGCAFGRDADGELFASFGVRAENYDKAVAKPNHIIVFRCVNENTPMPIIEKKTVWGAHSVMIGRRTVVMEAGAYSSPWGYVWQTRQIPCSSELARAILKKRADYYRGKNK